ncbi:CRISPR-associated endoribonuclease Cas6 [Inediibacterium massiliense]|uniref:CRISPR-associated endoribonuclease Cas6 n=1 Tax=Inediibacterium massiliense TaxID=1658111 RepID=UPI0006B55951|nr:CRISPR-associated endoribonuclease Cas6 [Inediibacterium massiliense]
MMFIELTVTVMLKKDIFFVESGYIIGKNINKAMLLDKDLKILHPRREYKYYIFNSFYPLEKNKTYIKGRVYVFKIRGLDCEYMEKFKRCLQKLESYDFEVISVATSEVKQKHINKLYSITPIIITKDNKPWLQGDDVEEFKKRLEANLEKKYKNFFGEDIDIQDKFIKSLEFKNKLPIYFKYKGIKLLGNKINVEIKDNDTAQKIAFMAMAIGMGEKNSSIGAGYCNAN